MHGAQAGPRQVCDPPGGDVGGFHCSGGDPSAAGALGEPHDRVRQEESVLVVEIGVDQPRDEVGDDRLDRLDCRRELRVAARAVAEEQLEGAVVIGDEMKVGREARLHLLTWSSGSARGRGDSAQQGLADVVEQLEEQSALGGEVLVQHWLGDPGGVGDVVHRRAVQAAFREQHERRVDQLSTTFGGGKSYGHWLPDSNRRADSVVTPSAYLARMPTRSSYPAGTPSYVDIGTPDVDATSTFYAGLFGWTVQDLGPDAGGYRMALKGESTAAGIAPAQDAGPPYWTSYITVDDVEAAAEAVQATGGTVVAPPMDVMEAGRMAVCVDPNGAPFAIWQPGQSIGAEIVNEHGALCWTELNTRHFESAKRFYSEVFGWKWNDSAEYGEFEVGGRVVGGMMPMTPDRFPAEVPEHWLVYFAVDDIDAAASRIKDLGGTTMMEPFNPGGVGKMVVAMDPQGAVFAVIQMDQPVD